MVIVVDKNPLIWMEFCVELQDEKAKRKAALVQDGIGGKLWFNNYEVETGKS